MVCNPKVMISKYIILHVIKSNRCCVTGRKNSYYRPTYHISTLDQPVLSTLLATTSSHRFLALDISTFREDESHYIKKNNGK